MKIKTIQPYSAFLILLAAFAGTLLAKESAAVVDKIAVEEALAAAVLLDTDFSAAFENCRVGIIDARLRDEEEGDDFNSLFDCAGDDFSDIDTTFAWNNHRINAGRFDYRTLGPEDTIRIALTDSSQGRVYVHPLTSTVVTSRFGPRRMLWHYGIDLKLATGDTLRSAFDGIVRVIQFDRRGYGNVVVVRHHNGLETLYGHLSRVTVQPNQRVKAGDQVGLGGNTGRSTGAHLHFEIRYLGEPFNPSHIIDFDNAFLKSDTLVLTRDNFEYLTVQRQMVVHTVRRGETLGSIARRYGTTVNNLCRLNGVTPRTTLRVGRRLVVRSGEQAKREVVQTIAAPSSPSDEAYTGGGSDDDVDDADDIDDIIE